MKVPADFRIVNLLYVLRGPVYADTVGAFNILKKYLAEKEKEIVIPVKGISDPIVIKAAVWSFQDSSKGVMDAPRSCIAIGCVNLMLGNSITE